MSLTLTYYDVPYGAQENARADGPGQPFGDAQAAVRGAADTAYATLEPGAWPLDGSRQIMGDSPDGFWWSLETSDSEGNFADPPTLEFSFPTPYTATGLTFTFWPCADEWCSRVRVTWLNGNTLLAQTSALPDSARWTLMQTVEGFDKVRVELLSTNMPGRFAKLQMLEFGQTFRFGKDELVSVQMVNEADPTLSELTVDTMTVQLRDREGRSLLPQQNQRVELYRDGQLLAVQYITQSTRQAGGYRFSCQSAIGLLEDTYLGGLYEAVSAKALLEDILDGQEFSMDAAFEGVSITGYLPVCTRREALQQLAFAIGALVTTQAGSAIRLLALPQTVTGTFAPEQVFQGASVETSPRLASIEVVSHSYAPSEEVQTLLENESINAEELLLTFREPYHSYAITGGTITESGANFVRITANGLVSLTGKPYIHNTARHVKRDPAATAAERNNTLTVEEATLVNGSNVEAVLARLYAAGQLRQRLKQDAVIAGHRAGQKVAAADPWGTQLRGYISAMESTLTQNGQTASVTVVGMEAAAGGIYCYAGELRSGDKEVLY